MDELFDVETIPVRITDGAFCDLPSERMALVAVDARLHQVRPLPATHFHDATSLQLLGPAVARARACTLYCVPATSPPISTLAANVASTLIHVVGAVALA